jgi:hypothetical protein
MSDDGDADRREPGATDAPIEQVAEADELDRLKEERRPLLARIGILVLAVAVVFFIFPLIAKLFVPPINPTQPAPPSHVSLDCGTCHMISPDVPVKSVR